MKLSKNNPLTWLASLRLTVVLLALAMYLIFVGTLAQAENGIWWVVKHYFREGNWGLVWVEFDVFRAIFAPGSETKWPGAHPYPSGFVIIGALLVNLLAAHALRFKVTGKGAALGAGLGLILFGAAVTAFTVLHPTVSVWIQQDVMKMMGIWALPMTLIGVGCYFVFGSRKAGIVLIHGGLILMLVGEYVTGLSAEEGQMWIHEQGASNTIIDIREVELAFVRDLGDGREEHVVIPQALIVSADKNETLIQGDALPMAVRVDRWMVNSDLVRPRVIADDPTQVLWDFEEKPTVTGTEQAINQPAAVVTLYDGKRRLEQYWLSSYGIIEPASVEVGEETWQVSLRFKKTHLPYALQLGDFKHDLFTGTSTPMNYSSTLHLAVPETNDSRDAFIKMNQPLRYDGKAFFQSGFFQQRLNRNLGTVLQVVDNPGAWVPYLSCVIVTVGLCMHFVVSLLKYGRRANAKA